MKVGVLCPEDCSFGKSDSELRRFFRGGPETRFSPMVLRALPLSRPNALRTFGRSRETGRLGLLPSILLTTSVDFERVMDPFEILDDWDSEPCLLLLSVRHTE